VLKIIWLTFLRRGIDNICELNVSVVGAAYSILLCTVRLFCMYYLFCPMNCVVNFILDTIQSFISSAICVTHVCYGLSIVTYCISNMKM